jgi:hypothetical protein
VLKPYYEKDGQAIYLGDCREILPLFIGTPIDLVLTDPPYNVGKDFGLLTDDRKPPAEYQAWLAEWFSLSRRVCMAHIIFPGMNNICFWRAISNVTAMGCWDKMGGGGRCALGIDDWEPYLFFHKGDRGFLGGHSVIHCRVGINTQVQGHPTPKPVELFKKVIHKAKAKFVLDPFLGSGTTLRACKDLQVKGIGIEINEAYCELAANRLQQGVLEFEERDLTPAKCVGHNGLGQWQCCARAGEYNGFDSGPLVFVCPEGCSCHD